MSKKPVTLEYILKGVKARLAAIPINFDPARRPAADPPVPPTRARRAPRQFSAFQAAVNKMTNWQRSQWGRAGYPGGAHEDLKPLKNFMRPRRALEVK